MRVVDWTAPRSNSEAHVHNHHATVPSENKDCDYEDVESGSFFAYVAVTVSVCPDLI